MEMLKMPPEEMIKVSPRSSLFFHKNNYPRLGPNSKGFRHIPGTWTVAEALQTTDYNFIDLLEKWFEWDPAKRITASEAIKHPWIKEGTIM